MSANSKTAAVGGGREFVTFMIADQLFGVEVTAIRGADAQRLSRPTRAAKV